LNKDSTDQITQQLQ